MNQPCNGVSSNGKTCSKSKEPFSENTFIYRQISYKFTSLSVHAEQIVVALPGGTLRTCNRVKKEVLAADYPWMDFESLARIVSELNDELEG